MGTSKSFTTPSGGGWTPVKKLVTNQISGVAEPGVASAIIGGTLRAAGGLQMPSISNRRVSAPSRRVSGNSGSGGAVGSGDGSGGGGHAAGGSLPKSLASVVGFGSAVRTDGLAAGLGRLGLSDLKGKQPAELVAVIANRISQDADALHAELLRDSLTDALLNIAAIEGDGSYSELEKSLQTFLAREGVEGLVEAFLSQYVFERVWMLIENHASLKGDSTTKTDGLEAAVEGACRANVRDHMQSLADREKFEKIDWFGTEGREVAESIVAGLEDRLTNL